jgi:hypothetical protein
MHNGQEGVNVKAHYEFGTKLMEHFCHEFFNVWACTFSSLSL